MLGTPRRPEELDTETPVLRPPRLVPLPVPRPSPNPGHLAAFRLFPLLPRSQGVGCGQGSGEGEGTEVPLRRGEGGSPL
jgi:hypothetical protein